MNNSTLGFAAVMGGPGMARRPGNLSCLFQTPAKQSKRLLFFFGGGQSGYSSSLTTRGVGSLKQEKLPSAHPSIQSVQFFFLVCLFAIFFWGGGWISSYKNQQMLMTKINK